MFRITDPSTVVGYTKAAPGRLLERLASKVPVDQVIVEIGVFHGRSTLYLARGAAAGRRAHVHAIDPWDLPGTRYPAAWAAEKRNRSTFTLAETRASAEANIAGSPWADGVTLHRTFGADMGLEWRDFAGNWGDGIAPQVGLLHIDGNHEYPHPKADFEAWAPHLSPGAHVLFDDWVPACPGVLQAVRELEDEGRITPAVLGKGCRRLAVARFVK